MRLARGVGRDSGSWDAGARFRDERRPETVAGDSWDSAVSAFAALAAALPRTDLPLVEAGVLGEATEVSLSLSLDSA